MSICRPCKVGSPPGSSSLTLVKRCGLAPVASSNSAGELTIGVGKRGSQRGQQSLQRVRIISGHCHREHQQPRQDHRDRIIAVNSRCQSASWSNGRTSHELSQLVAAVSPGAEAVRPHCLTLPSTQQQLNCIS
ncbi:unnamed protein product [Polarella glacialis]|uniref:Uncharacterized protein n=1 Tax=Polarella glacialis TaxID=89957 RepID=A0A813KEL1_POLGL|nr:unnamed protein product [Polarella glacialis]